jgi:hypothetical protein
VGEEFLFQTFEKDFQTPPLGRLKVPQKTVPIEKEKKKTEAPSPAPSHPVN